uniref:Uncharacterized protein n=1 Tax=uncultured marine virus TaxID=186617 RepID=A0A0F7L6T6_9VIRU|nr:hypothetical protein [uncultured marine virus]
MLYVVCEKSKNASSTGIPKLKPIILPRTVTNSRKFVAGCSGLICVRLSPSSNRLIIPGSKFHCR